MEKKCFRIQTDGSDKNLIIQLNQTYDTLDILSLKISQDKIYRSFSSDYGVLIGRVIANDGIGVPNVKISVFIPLSENDQQNISLSQIYPYTSVTDKDNLGVRYNLITPKNFPGGTFPSKQQILDDDLYLEIYENYYKYTTITNSSGDYMIFGIPIGQQIIHMDADLSDIGQYSYTADAMVANGISQTLFVQSGNTFSFKGGTDLDQLPQVISQNLSVNIIPLWGDVTDPTQIGISRLDFKVSILINPVAYLTFSIGVDGNDRLLGGYDGKNRTVDNHVRVDDGNHPGALSRMTNSDLTTIVAYEYDDNGNQLPYNPLSFKIINKQEEGVYILLLPCNLDKVVTDQYGNQIPSNDPNKGIGTTGKWRVEVYSNNGERLINWLVQKNGDAEPFIVKSGRIYSVKFQTYDAFTIRDDGGRNIFNSNVETSIMNVGDWINGFLYFGFGFFDTTGDNRPDWLYYGSGFYNIESRIIDVTDYLNLLALTIDPYPTYNFVFLDDNEIGSIVTQMKLNNSLIGDNNSSYEPSPASFFNNRYVFLKGLRKDWDCFKEIKNYLNI